MRSRGPAGVVRAVARRLLRRRVRSYEAAKQLLRGRSGLEIGGPSSLFQRHGPFPIYTVVGRLDNCNFSRNTIWEGAIEEGPTFRFDPKHAPGRQYILEASDLSAIASASYDFVLASHTLEHIANPLRALREWTRTLKAGGVLVLVLPDREHTFDHRRATTTFGHLIDDHERGIGEDDLTHVPEILECHDLAMDPPAGDVAAFRARSERNLENRCLHHHVFDPGLVTKTIEWAGLELLAIELAAPHHILALARKR
jgi:SAM-dependent methyltransferase